MLSDTVKTGVGISQLDLEALAVERYRTARLDEVLSPYILILSHAYGKMGWL